MIINDLFNNKKQGMAEGYVPINISKMPTDPAPEPKKVEPKHKYVDNQADYEQYRQAKEKLLYNVVGKFDRKVLNPEPLKGLTAAEEFMKQNGLGGGNADLVQVSTIRFHATGIDASGKRVVSEPLTDMKDVGNFYKQHGINQFASTTDLTTTDDGNITEDNSGPVTHRIGLTVTDPNHPMISKRGETIQKTVRVPGADREKAINSAIAHYRRKGYKVHDHHYIGTVDDEIKEFAPPGGDDGNDGFSDKALKRMAAQWWKGDEDPRVEKALAAAGWEIGQDAGYDNGGVFVVRAGDVDGDSYMSWPAEELKGLKEGKKPDSYHIVNKDGKPATLASYADKASAVKDRDAKHPDAEVRQLGPRGKVKGVSESMADDMAAMAQKKFPNAYISKNGQEVQKPENWGKPYTPPAAAPVDLEKQQRELTAKYPNIDELVRKAELNRDPNYEYADGQAYYAARDAEQNYQKLRQIQRVIQGLNESLNRSHLP